MHCYCVLKVSARLARTKGSIRCTARLQRHELFQELSGARVSASRAKGEAALVGPGTFEQWQSNLGALDCEWTKEDAALVDSLLPHGRPSTPGYTDPQHQVLGRFPTVA